MSLSNPHRSFPLPLLPSALLRASLGLVLMISAVEAQTIGFNSASSSGAEEVTPVNIQIDVAGYGAWPVTVDLSVVGGSTTASGGGVDYSVTTGQLEYWANGSYNVTVTITDDPLDENDEDVTLGLSFPSAGSIDPNAQHTYTINDNDNLPMIQFSSASSSGAESVTPATFTLTLSTVSGRYVEVYYAVTGGTATGGGIDYTLAAGYTTITAGNTTTNITATILDDSETEPDETIVVTLSNPANATLGTNTSHTYTILDNDDSPPAAPTIVTTTPAQNALNVPLDTVVAVTFDVDMNADSINARTFIVRGNYTGDYSGTYSYDSGTYTATFTPSAPFKAGEVGSVTLTTGAQSTAGDTLASPYAWAFTTEVAGGSGEFSPRTTYAAGSYPYSVYAADLDGDGDLDLVTANEGSDNVSVLLGSGDGTFAAQTTFAYAAGNDPQSVYAADLDGDGYLDLATANVGSNNVSVLLGRGDGTFAAQTTYAAGDCPVSVYAADLDGDGDLDLVTGNACSNNVSVLLGSGDGTFAAQTTYAAGNTPESVYAADLDGDGDLDLAVANDNISVLLGSGDGTFAAPTTYATGDWTESVYVADLDGDGNLDLVTANCGSENVSVLLGNGYGIFAAQTTYAVGHSAYSVYAADLDGDGDLDLATANEYDDNVSVLLGSGDGTFAAPTTYTTDYWPWSIYAADLDGDGDLDLATANWRDDNNVSVLLNTADPYPPAAPTGLTAAPGDGQVTLTWSANTEPDLSHYMVYQSTTPGFTPTSADAFGPVDKQNTAVSITPLSNGTTYYYRITAVDSSGNESGYSEERSATPGVNTAPVAMADTAATNEDTPISIHILENDTDADGDALSVTFAAQGTNGSVTIDVGDTTVIYTPNTGFYGWDHFVYAVTDGALSDTGAVTVIVIAITEQPPAAPTGLAATPGDGQVALAWSANSEPDLSHYVVYMTPGYAPDSTESVAEVNKPNTTVTITDLTNGETYYFKLTAVDSSGNVSGVSAEVSAVPHAVVVITDTQTVTGDGTVDFAGTNVALRFWNHTGTDTITVTYFASAPSGTLPSDISLVVPKYWEIDARGSGSFTIEMTFVLGPGALTSEEENAPSRVKLLRRDNGTVASWTLAAEGSSTLADSGIVFTGITGFSQFTIGSQADTGVVPAAITSAATNVTSTSATLNGTVNPNGNFTVVFFEWGETMAYGDLDIATPDSIDGTTELPVNVNLTGLSPGTTYHFRVMAQYVDGSSYGDDQAFTTQSSDTEGPLISNITTSPTNPYTGQDITVQATVIDTSGLQEVNLMVIGGGWSTYEFISMTHQWGDTYTGTIPGSNASIDGLAFYIQAVSPPDTSYSDTASIQVKFAADALSTALPMGFYKAGFPKDKWRLVSVPAQLDEPGVLATIGDELGERTTKTWRIFSLVGGEYIENPNNLNTGVGYWLYQRQGEDLTLKTGAGISTELTGFDLILHSGWNFIGSPYAFTVPIDADQGQFYGPLTYALNGTEGWSDVVTELLPWGGYAIYNRESASATILIDPLTPPQALTKAQDNEVPGWRLKIEATSETYSDVGNYIGRLKGATEQLDRFDNPEPPHIDGYISLAMERPEWGDNLPGFTSDIRSAEDMNGVWDMDIHTKGESGPIVLTSEFEGEAPADFRVVLLDVITRQLHDLLDESNTVTITDYREEFPYHLKAVAGSQAWVDAKVKEILAQLPSEFALSQNYPNPFNPVTHIRFTLPRPDKVTLRVYNLLGREVATLKEEWLDLGEHEVLWNGYDRFGRPLSSGVYFARLAGSRQSRTVKMVLMK